MTKRYQVNKAFTDAASRRAKRQVSTHIRRANAKGSVKVTIIDPRFSEKPKLTENDGAVLDIKKKVRGFS